MKTTSTWQLLLPVLLTGVLGLAGCNNNNHHNAATPSTGAVAGTVTNAACAAGASGATVAGATVTADPSGANTTTDASGTYSLAGLAPGDYTLTIASAGFTSQTVNVTVTAGQTATGDATLSLANPNNPVQITSTVNGTPTPGQSVSVTAVATPLNCTTVTSYRWAESKGVPLGDLSGADTDTVTATLPSVTAYKDEYFRILGQERGEIETDSEGNIVVDEDTQEPARGTVILNRYMVMGTAPFDLAEAGTTVLTVTVTTSDGQSYPKDVNVTATLPFDVTTGVQNVPVGAGVLLHGAFKGTKPTDPPPTDAAGKPIPEAQSGYTWTISGPGNPALNDAASQDPWFTPTAAGKYIVSEGSPATDVLTIYAGTWAGLITGQDANGRPVGTSCFPACHANNAPEAVVSYNAWQLSGHAEIFTQNVDAPSPNHYSSSCFVCHTVGYDLNAANNGFDDQSDYADMLSTIFANNGLVVVNPDNWTNILANYPKTAGLANIQCENCHGPNNPSGPGAAHATFSGFVPERFSLSADVCGSCHGEPLRHGRYQQWQESGHANYNVAVNEGFSVAADGSTSVRNSCAGCHTGQGFLVWLTQLESGDASRVLTPESLASPALANLTPQTVQPQTCAVCHDPHDPGTTSGPTTNAQPRVTGSTPKLPAGFAAENVGKGAMCITCHNSRNGEASNGEITLHQDGDPNWGTLTSFSAPHEACQGDTLMGRNAYFVDDQNFATTHATIPDTCVNCHMVKTPPDPNLSIEGGGTNHQFAASPTICIDCHTSGSPNADQIQTVGKAQIDAIQAAFQQAVTKLKGDGVAVTYKGGRQPVVTPAGGAETPIPVYLPNLTPAQTDTLAKANWNYSLLDQDASEGVHNPPFYQAVSSATVAQLNGL